MTPAINFVGGLAILVARGPLARLHFRILSGGKPWETLPPAGQRVLRGFYGLAGAILACVAIGVIVYEVASQPVNTNPVVLGVVAVVLITGVACSIANGPISKGLLNLLVRLAGTGDPLPPRVHGFARGAFVAFGLVLTVIGVLFLVTAV